jgi:hypothetical protein
MLWIPVAKTRKKAKRYSERNIKKKVGVVGVIKTRASMKPHMQKNTKEREERERGRDCGR